jgi:hypothetical protein
MSPDIDLGICSIAGGREGKHGGPSRQQITRLGSPLFF